MHVLTSDLIKNNKLCGEPLQDLKISNTVELFTRTFTEKVKDQRMNKKNK